MDNKSLFLNLTFFLLGTLLLSGCAGNSFNHQIEKDQYDLLTEESFMRYNTNRLQAIQNVRKDLISQALIACHQKRVTKGTDLLEEKMHNNRTNPYYWNALGTCYALSSDQPKALFYYQLGLEAARGAKKDTLAEAVVFNNMGLIHLTFKRYDEAFDMFKKAHQNVPSYFAPEFNMAQLFIEFNENNKALEILNRLEQKNRDDIDLLYSLSLVHFRLNDYDKSFHYISRIHADYLNRANIVGLYAYNLMRKNRLIEAKTILEKRLYADPYNARNESILEEINSRIKELPETK